MNAERRIGISMLIVFFAAAMSFTAVGCGDDDDTSNGGADVGPDEDECTMDNDGHDACREDYDDDGYFCGPDNECVQANFCEAQSCCLPGASGDSYCRSQFGSDSSCVPGDTDGSCSM